MKKSEAIPIEMQGADLAPLTYEELCLIRHFRVMRASARKMMFDLSVEYAREFPDPKAGAAPS